VSEDLTQEEIEELGEDLKQTAIAWLKSGEDVIISLHCLSLMIGVVTLTDEEAGEVQVVH
jgi:hypothetical protein